MVAPLSKVGPREPVLYYSTDPLVQTRVRDFFVRVDERSTLDQVREGFHKLLQEIREKEGAIAAAALLTAAFIYFGRYLGPIARRLRPFLRTLARTLQREVPTLIRGTARVIRPVAVATRPIWVTAAAFLLFRTARDFIAQTPISVISREKVNFSPLISRDTSFAHPIATGFQTLFPIFSDRAEPTSKLIAAGDRPAGQQIEGVRYAITAVVLPEERSSYPTFSQSIAAVSVETRDVLQRSESLFDPELRPADRAPFQTILLAGRSRTSKTEMRSGERHLPVAAMHSSPLPLFVPTTIRQTEGQTLGFENPKFSGELVSEMGNDSSDRLRGDSIQEIPLGKRLRSEDRVPVSEPQPVLVRLATMDPDFPMPGSFREEIKGLAVAPITSVRETRREVTGRLIESEPDPILHRRLSFSPDQEALVDSSPVFSLPYLPIGVFRRPLPLILAFKSPGRSFEDLHRGDSDQSDSEKEDQSSPDSTA